MPLQKFTVVMSFIGECCTAPHLWVQTVSATSEAAAVRKVAKEVVADGGESHDYIVYPGKLFGEVRELE